MTSSSTAVSWRDAVVKLAAKIGILTSVLATRLEGIEQAKSK